MAGWGIIDKKTKQTLMWLTAGRLSEASCLKVNISAVPVILRFEIFILKSI